MIQPTYAAAQLATNRIHRHLATHPVPTQLSADLRAPLDGYLEQTRWAALRRYFGRRGERTPFANTGLRRRSGRRVLGLFWQNRGWHFQRLLLERRSPRHIHRSVAPDKQVIS